MVFWLSALLVFAAAVFSFLRGGRYVYDEIKTPNVVFSNGGSEPPPDAYVVARSKITQRAIAVSCELTS